MAEDQVGAYHDNGQPAYWIEAGTGKPYKYKTVNGVEDRSQKLYLSPQAMGNYEDTGKPEGGFFHGGGEWNTETGEWDQPFNWGNLMSLGVGGAIAAPVVGPALMSAFGGGAGGASMPALYAPASVLPAGTAGMIGAPAAASAVPLASAAAAGGGLSKYLGPALAAGIPAV